MGQQIDQRQQQHELPQHRHDDGAGGVADGHKGHLAGDLDAHQEQGPAVDPQHPGGEGHQLRVGSEDPGKDPGEQLDAAPQHQGVAQAYLQQQPEGLAHPLGVARPVVIAGDGLGPLGDALKGQHGELHDAGQNGHGSHRQVPAVFQQGGVEAHGDDAFAGLHDERRRTQGHAGQDQPGPDGQGGLFQPQQGLFSPQEGDYPHAGDALGQHRGQGSPPDAHVQDEDEQRVQQNVGHRADEHRFHAHLGEALGGDEGIEAQGQLHEQGAQGVNAHILGGVFDGVPAGAEGQQQRPVPYQQHCRQYQGNGHL